jgi:flagellar basal body-associated protein FliL
MLKILVPVLLGLIGLGGGIGAGLYLRPGPDAAAEAPCGEMPAGDGKGSGAKQGVAAEGAHADGEKSASEGEAAGSGEDAAGPEYVKLNNQFIVPIVEDGAVKALVILSLSLEVKAGTTQDVYAREPKIRDGFLEVLFAHANAGGFAGSFTESRNIDTLRQALLEMAQKTLGERVTNVLITDIVRQDT